MSPWLSDATGMASVAAHRAWDTHAYLGTAAGGALVWGVLLRTLFPYTTLFRDRKSVV